MGLLRRREVFLLLLLSRPLAMSLCGPRLSRATENAEMGYVFVGAGGLQARAAHASAPGLEALLPRSWREPPWDLT